MDRGQYSAADCARLYSSSFDVSVVHLAFLSRWIRQAGNRSRWWSQPAVAVRSWMCCLSLIGRVRWYDAALAACGNPREVRCHVRRRLFDQISVETLWSAPTRQADPHHTSSNLCPSSCWQGVQAVEAINDFTIEVYPPTAGSTPAAARLALNPKAAGSNSSNPAAHGLGLLGRSVPPLIPRLAPPAPGPGPAAQSRMP